KPLDVAAISALALECGAIVKLEEHNVIGGLGSAVAEVIAERGGGRLVRLGIRDRFVDQGGTYTGLLNQYGVSVEAATAAVRALLTDGAAITTTEKGVTP